MNISNWIFIFIALSLIISFIIAEGILILEGNKRYKKESKYIFILGAKLYGDRPSPILSERLKTGLKYLKKYKNTKVIVTGGKGHDEIISEAKAMKQYLIKNGIKDSRIILEDKSINTFQNIKFGLDKIRKSDNSNNTEILIVTSKFHIFRSKLIARKLGVKAYGLPAKVPPSTVVLSYIREYFALVKTILIDK